MYRTLQLPTTDRRRRALLAASLVAVALLAVALLLPAVSSSQAPPPFRPPDPIETASSPWRWGKLDLTLTEIQHRGPTSNPAVGLQNWEGTFTDSLTVVDSTVLLDEREQAAWLAEYTSRDLGTALPGGWIRGGTIGSFGRLLIQRIDKSEELLAQDEGPPRRVQYECTSPVMEAEGGVAGMWYERESDGERQVVLVGIAPFGFFAEGNQAVACDALIARHPSSPIHTAEWVLPISYARAATQECPCSVHREFTSSPVTQSTVPPKYLESEVGVSVLQTKRVEITEFSMTFTSDDHANWGQLQAPVGLLDTATVIGTRSETIGSIEYQGDEDWFVFEAETGERITVSTLLVLESTRLTLTLEQSIVNVYDRGIGGAPLPDADPEKLGVTFTVPVSGKYYVSVQGAPYPGGQPGGYAGSYILKVNRGLPEITTLDTDVARNRTSDVVGVLLGGDEVPPVDITLRADVDWMEAEPGSVEFRLGELTETAAAADACTTRDFTGLTFPKDPAGVVTVEATALTPLGKRSEPATGDSLAVVDLEQWVIDGLQDTDARPSVDYEPVPPTDEQPCGGTERVIYTFEGSIPSPPWDFRAEIPSDVPYVGGSNRLAVFIAYTLTADSGGPVTMNYRFEAEMKIGGVTSWESRDSGTITGTLDAEGIDWTLAELNLAGDIPIYKLGGSLGEAIELANPFDAPASDPELAVERARGWFARVIALLSRLTFEVSLKATWNLDARLEGRPGELTTGQLDLSESELTLDLAPTIEPVLSIDVDTVLFGSLDVDASHRLGFDFRGSTSPDTRDVSGRGDTVWRNDGRFAAEAIFDAIAVTCAYQAEFTWDFTESPDAQRERGPASAGDCITRGDRLDALIGTLNQLGAAAIRVVDRIGGFFADLSSSGSTGFDRARPRVDAPIAAQDAISGKVIPAIDVRPAVAALRAGGAIAVWETQTLGRSEASGRDLAWSRYRDGAWSRPAPIGVEGLADLRPSIAPLPDGGAVAVWQTIADGDGFAALSTLELWWSAWDATTEAWTAPQRLTDDDALDDGTTLEVGPDGSLVLAWRTNESGYLAPDDEHPDRLHVAEWTGDGWSEPAVAADGLADLASWDLAVGDGRRALVLSRGAIDGEDLWVVEHSDSGWAAPAVLIAGDQPDVAPQAVYSDGELVVTWLSGTEVAASINGAETRIPAGNSPLEWLDSQLHATAGGVTVTRSANGDDGAGVYRRSLTADGWGDDVPIVTGAPVTRVSAAVAADGRIHLMGVIPTEVDPLVELAVFNELVAPAGGEVAGVATEADSGVPVLLWLAIGIVVIAAGGGAVFLRTQRRAGRLRFQRPR